MMIHREIDPEFLVYVREKTAMLNPSSGLVTEDGLIPVDVMAKMIGDGSEVGADLYDSSYFPWRLSYRAHTASKEAARGFFLDAVRLHRSHEQRSRFALQDVIYDLLLLSYRGEVQWTENADKLVFDFPVVNVHEALSELRREYFSDTLPI